MGECIDPCLTSHFRSWLLLSRCLLRLLPNFSLQCGLQMDNFHARSSRRIIVTCIRHAWVRRFRVRFALFLYWKEVVKALSISFHCGYSSIGCCPLYKRHLLDFEMLLMDPCPVGALFSLNPSIWKLSKIPYSMSKPIFIEICEFYLIDCTPIEPMVLDRRGSIKIYLSRTCLGCLASMHNIASHIPNL